MDSMNYTPIDSPVVVACRPRGMKHGVKVYEFTVHCNGTNRTVVARNADEAIKVAREVRHNERLHSR